MAAKTATKPRTRRQKASTSILAGLIKKAIELEGKLSEELSKLLLLGSEVPQDIPYMLETHFPGEVVTLSDLFDITSQIFIEHSTELEEVHRVVTARKLQNLSNLFARNERLEESIKTAEAALALYFHNQSNSKASEAASLFEAIISTEIPSFRKTLCDIFLLAPTAEPILLLGEPGVGKSVIAEGIHYSSKRRAKKFYKLNLAGLSKESAYSELFGHKKGSFLGANRDRAGAFKQASGSTLLLEGIDEVDTELQGLLLRAIQTQTINPLGSDAEVRIDVRLILTANTKIYGKVENNTFRPDLFYCLHRFPFFIPPLCQRRADIMSLARIYLQRAERKFGKKLTGLDSGAEHLLTQELDWPGNLYELKNVIEYAVAFSSRPKLTEEDFTHFYSCQNALHSKTASPLSTRADSPGQTNDQQESGDLDIERYLVRPQDMDSLVEKPKGSEGFNL